MKKSSRLLTLDNLHKGFVWFCIGVTAVGSLQLCSHFINFFVVRKPMIEANQQKELLELLKEGRESEENLKDTAPITKS